MRKDYALVSSQTTSAQETTGACWRCIFQPNEAELARLKEDYALPDGYVEAALDDHEDARSEALAAGAPSPGFILVREPYRTKSPNGHLAFETMPIALLLVPDGLVTISKQEPRLMTEYLKALDEVDTADSLALRIVDGILDCYTADANEIDDQTRKMERRVKEAAKNTLIYEVMALDKSLVYFRAALGHIQDLIDQMQKADRYFQAAADQRIRFLLGVKVSQLLTMVTSTEAILDQYNAAISSVVANNLNLIMKMLTSVSILLAIPPVVSGIFGQNTWLPWKDGPAYGFWLTLALAFGLSALAAWWLHRKDYF